MVADHLYKNFLAAEGFRTVLFVDTASEPEIGKEAGDDWWLVKDLQSLEAQGYQVDRYTITGKTREEIEKQIDEHDVLYMCGGNTAYLLNQLRKTDSFVLIKQKVNGGKPYIGTSAGSIIAGPYLPEYFIDEEPELTDRSCLGFVNFTMVPHWGSPDFREEYLGGRLEKVYTTTQDPLLIVTDTQYVAVKDDGSWCIIAT